MSDSHLGSLIEMTSRALTLLRTALIVFERQKKLIVFHYLMSTNRVLSEIRRNTYLQPRKSKFPQP